MQRASNLNGSADIPRAAFPHAWVKFFEAFIDYLQSECGLAENTIEAYSRDISEFLETLGELAPLQPIHLTITEVQKHLARLDARGLGLASIARKAIAVKVFIRYLYRMGCLTNDVSELMESSQKWHRLPVTLHPAEVQRLLSSPNPQSPFYHRDRAILEFLYATGLRVSEVVNLNLNDVNLDIGFVRCMGKGRRERIVPVGRPAIEAIRAYLLDLRPTLIVGRHDEYALFVTRTGRRMDRTAVWRLVSLYARQADIRGHVGPHTLRHCFATHLLRGGADLRVVQELLGHADVSTTQIYTHVDSSHLKDVHRRFHPRP
jgi:integrase/recombinase XerD